MVKLIEFMKITKYIKLEIPILKDYNYISMPILDSSLPDYFLSSFFMGYIYNILKNSALNQLENFISLFEHSFLPYFEEYEHNFFKPNLPEDCLNFLKELVVLANECKPNEAFLDKFKDKKKKMVFIVKVVLFCFLSKISKDLTSQTDRLLKKDVKEKMMMLLKNEEILLEPIYFFFLSAAFQLNIIVFDEEKSKE